MTGQQAALGILAAERHRRLTGKGQVVELALKDMAFAMLGNLGIIGKQPWTWSGNPSATPQNNLAESDSMKDRSFINSIAGNQFQNQIPAGVETARTCMMGRKSAELGRTVTWDEIEKDQEKYELGFDVKKFH